MLWCLELMTCNRYPIIWVFQPAGYVVLVVSKSAESAQIHDLQVAQEEDLHYVLVLGTFFVGCFSNLRFSWIYSQEVAECLVITHFVHTLFLINIHYLFFRQSYCLQRDFRCFSAKVNRITDTS